MPLLSEAESKRFLAAYGVPFPPERLARSAAEAVAAAEDIGFPVAVKLTGATIAHKTERGLVRLHLASADAVEAAATALLAATEANDDDVGLLIAPMVEGHREFIAGLHRDETFGPVVLLGLGGVLAEAVEDVVCRLVPITAADAAEMVDDLRSQRLLGPCRGQPPVDRGKLAEILLALSLAGERDERVVSADLNPLIIRGGEPIPVDALVELSGATGGGLSDADH
jgi:acetate---CoA ligase (ADP-forming) subunit beta